MAEQEVLYRLVGDVSGLKADVENLSESQRVQWTKIDRMQEILGEVNRKLDKLVDQESRLDEAEAWVAEYRKDRNRVVAGILGIGLGSGSGAGFLAAWASKWLGP